MGYVIIILKDGRKIAFDYGFLGKKFWRVSLQDALKDYYFKIKKVFKFSYQHKHFIFFKKDYEIIKKKDWIYHGILYYIED